MGIFLGRLIREQTSQDLSAAALSQAITVPKGVLRKLSQIHLKASTAIQTETVDIYLDPGGDTNYRAELATNTFGANEDRYTFRPTGECLLFADDVLTVVTGGITTAATVYSTIDFLEG